MRPAPTGESLLEHWARTLGMHGAYAPAFERGGEEFGNALLTRWPIVEQHAHDVSLRGYRRRVVLEALVHVDGVTLQIMSLHLGVSPRERALQAQQLFELCSATRADFHLLLGDFNEWSRFSAVSRRLARVLRRHAPVGDVSVAGARRRPRSRLGAPSRPPARDARGCVAGRPPRVGSPAARGDDRLLVTRLQWRKIVSVHRRRGLRRAAHDRADLRVVVAERAIAELALELDVALLGQQALDLVRTEHAHDARETLRRAAAVVRDGARREQPNRLAREQLR